jgi:hypothetical protein
MLRLAIHFDSSKETTEPAIPKTGKKLTEN